jgi:hypothetical protein
VKAQPTQDLDQLVDELMKDQPDEKRVKALMLKLGVPYSRDPVERINRVLLKMHPPMAVEDEHEPHP